MSVTNGISKNSSVILVPQVCDQSLLNLPWFSWIQAVLTGRNPEKGTRHEAGPLPFPDLFFMSSCFHVVLLKLRGLLKDAGNLKSNFHSGSFCVPCVLLRPMNPLPS
jgi:hypothetical protein